MSINFWPPLELMAYSKIAQRILYTFDLEVLKRTFLLGGPLYTEYRERIEEKVSAVVLPPFETTHSSEVKHLVLPTEIQKKLVGIVMALGFEVKTWFECHKVIVSAGDLNLRKQLHWFPFGIIDRHETARNFIQDVNFNIRERFHLACIYYFGDDVQMLWRNMSTDDRFYVTRQLPRSRCLELWLQTLQRNIPIDWEAISRNERRNFFRSNSLGIRRYFANLRGPEMRYQCINYILEIGNVHNFDLYSCMSLMNTNELNFTLRRLQTQEFCELFKSFLQWPFQIMFLGIVKDFQQHISEDVFHGLVTIILYDKLGMGWQDHLYVDLFKCFWNLLAATYEAYVRNDKDLYVLVEYVLESSEDLDIREYLHLLNEYFSE
ncbi:uncharacterized protein TNCV_2472101 [Trichonephila clavipes]|nr:uncharacterized protein TNCV_2472101 [Trichonephila clavipes]